MKYAHTLSFRRSLLNPYTRWREEGRGKMTGLGNKGEGGSHIYMGREKKSINQIHTKLV